MHVGTYHPYAYMYLAAKYLEKNIIFFLIYKMPEKGVNQHQKNLVTELMQLPTTRTKIFLYFKAVHNVKQKLLHRPLHLQVEQERSSQLALPTQITQNFYIAAMTGCQLFYPKSLRILSWLSLFFFFIICQSS